MAKVKKEEPDLLQETIWKCKSCGRFSPECCGTCWFCKESKERPNETERPLRNIQAADALAYCCVKAIMRGTINSRSAISDAVLDYLNIGGLGGESTVSDWLEKYEKEKAPIYCHACSEVGGGNSPIFHDRPACRNEEGR